MINDERVAALIDSGCSRSIISSEIITGLRLKPAINEVLTMSGEKVRCIYESEVKITLRGRQLLLSCIVAPRMIDGYQLLLGMDSINKIGSVTFRKGEVIFGSVAKVEAQRLSCVEAQDKEHLINLTFLFISLV